MAAVDAPADGSEIECDEQNDDECEFHVYTMGSPSRANIVASTHLVDGFQAASTK
jgi:hypothetical protein